MDRLMKRTSKQQRWPTISSRKGLLSALLSVVVALAGCSAGAGAYKKGLDAELAQDYEQALVLYEQALAEKPGDIKYRLKAQQVRFAAAFAHFQNGRRALADGNPEAALAEFRRAQQLDPTNELAGVEIERTEALLNGGAAPEQAVTASFEDLKEAARVDASLDNQLNATMTGPISLRMSQEADAIYKTVAEMAGLNVIFDPDFRSTAITVELDNVTVYDALDILALQTRTFWLPINPTTIIVAPENQQKRRDYEQHILKTIYFSNSVNPTDITEAITAIRTLLNMRFIAQSTSNNAIILRDTPAKIAIAEKIIDDIDKARPEILVEATVLEVDRNRLRDLGILPPAGTIVSFDSGGTDGGGDDGGGPGGQAANRQVNLRDLPGINSGSFNLVIPDVIAEFLESDSQTRLVQNPSVRATDGKTATIHIGSRVPVASGSFQPAFVGATGTPVVQFTYIDLGVNLQITPRVLLNREISMVVDVQVAATAGTSVIGGVALPVLSNRQVTHEIRLKEGETNILGGLISRTESTSVSGIPGLSKIPILKYLFSTETRQEDTTEIIILLTPHIVKMPDITARNLNGLRVGTEMNTRLMRPAAPEPEEAEEEIPDTGQQPPDPAALVPPEPAATLQPTGRDSVSFAESEVTLELGMTGELIVQINAAAIAGADLVIEFDPDAIALREVSEGDFLGRDGNAVTLLQNIDTTRGRAVISLERPIGSGALTGNGDIVRLALEPLRSGESVLRITSFLLRTATEETRTGLVGEVRITVP